MTESALLREKGNRIYLSITENLSPVIMKSRIEEAKRLYLSAYNQATNYIDKTSAAKNISKTAFKCLKFYANDSRNKNSWHFYINEFLLYAREALVEGEQIRDYQWSNDICQTTTNAVQFYFDLIINEDYKERIRRLCDLLRESSNEAKCQINFYISKLIFQNSVELMDTRRYKEALSCLRDFDFHYEECLKNLKYYECDDEINLNELESLREDHILQTCIAEGISSKHVAQDLLRKCIEENEDLNFDLLFDIIDRFRDSIIKTRNNDIECEAEVSSELGQIYDEILKIKEKGKEYYQNSFHLAESLKPKIFTKHSWYIKCTAAIIRYQQEAVQKDNKELDEEREKIMSEIKDDIEEIKNKSAKGSFDFLEFIYKKYPPKNKKHVLPSKLDSSNIKESVRNALIHYHPDKNSKQEFGTKWYFISESIAKHLNTFYGMLKA